MWYFNLYSFIDNGIDNFNFYICYSYDVIKVTYLFVVFFYNHLLFVRYSLILTYKCKGRI